jgi:transposase
MSVREATKEFGVPKTTMLDRLAGRRGNKLGRSTELTDDEEKMIVERLQEVDFLCPYQPILEQFMVPFLILLKR